MTEYMKQYRRYFYAPDGAKFYKEEALIKYMDKHYGVV